MINPRFPFPPHKVPFFYGWAILALGTVGMIVSAPGQTIGVSVFTDSLIDVLSISRVNLSLAYLCGTLASSFILGPVGRLYDRLGARILGSAATLALGLSLIFLSRVDRAAAALSRVLRVAPSEVLAFATVTAGFFAIRFFGQGVLTLCGRNMVMKWFDRRRGMANAVMGMGLALGFSYAPRIFNDMLTARGWRGAWMILGQLLCLVFTPLFFLTWREDPRSTGMKPDGGLAARGRKPTIKTHPDRDFTLAEARRTYTFWVYLFTLALFSMYTTGLTFHIVSVFGKAGMDRVTAVSIFLPATVISLAVNFGSGWASDHMPLRPFLAAQASAILLTTAAVFFLAPGLPYVLLIAGHGVTIGLVGLLSTVTWPRFYGTTHLGAITGAVIAWMVGGSAIGPYVFSLALRYTGSYGTVSAVSGFVALALLAAAARAGRPEHPSTSRKASGDVIDRG